jgi:hypothetical protein
VRKCTIRSRTPTKRHRQGRCGHRANRISLRRPDSLLRLWAQHMRRKSVDGNRHKRFSAGSAVADLYLNLANHPGRGQFLYRLRSVRFCRDWAPYDLSRHSGFFERRAGTWGAGFKRDHVNGRIGGTASAIDYVPRLASVARSLRILPSP